MKLHDLQVGQRFSFTDKHRGKVFEVTKVYTVESSKHPAMIVFLDVATGEERTAPKNRKTFRMEVRLVTDNRVVELTETDVHLLTYILDDHYRYLCETGASEWLKSEINKLYLKITGLPGRRVVLPDDVNPSPNGE